MDEITPDISKIITKEEVEDFYRLLEKMNKAYAEIDKYNIDNLEEQNQHTTDAEEPYQIVLKLGCEVFRSSNSITIAKEIIENYSKNYIIDIVTDNVDSIVESLLSHITQSLTEKCKIIIPKSSKETKHA